MSFKKAATLAGLCIFVTLLFPPFHETISVMGATKNAGYGFILFPPVTGARIDIAVLLVEWLGISMILALLAHMPSPANLINIVTRGVKVEVQKHETTAQINFGQTAVKLLTPMLKFGIFALITIATTGCVLLAGRFIVYELLGIAPDDFSRPATAFEFVVIPLAIVALFRKIVLQKSIKTQLIGLGFYLSCTGMAIFLVSVNQAELAPAFEWLGLAGLAAYLAIKPFKKSAELT